MKNYLLLLLTLIGLNSCVQDDIIIESIADKELFKVEKEKKQPKLEVCHYDAKTGIWETISINENALNAHLKHGDYEGNCGFFESMFLNNQTLIRSEVSLSGGVLKVFDVFEDKVLLSTYRTDTGTSEGDYIMFAHLSLRKRDDWAEPGYGELITYFTRNGVIPYSFKPISKAYAWFPYHTVKNVFAISGKRATINIDGTNYDLYSDTFSHKTYEKIIIDQNVFNVVTLANVFPVNHDRFIDGVMETVDRITITPQQMVSNIEHTITQSTNYLIGYMSMWSVNPKVMKYQLLNNGNKFIYSGIIGTQLYNEEEIYEFGYNSDYGYGCAVITYRDENVNWGTMTQSKRSLITSQGGNKAKLYFHMLSGAPIVGSNYKKVTKFIWGESNDFQLIYNSAPIENP